MSTQLLDNPEETWVIEFKDLRKRIEEERKKQLKKLMERQENGN